MIPVNNRTVHHFSGQAKVTVDPAYHEIQYPHYLPLEGFETQMDLNDEGEDGLLQ